MDLFIFAFSLASFSVLLCVLQDWQLSPGRLANLTEHTPELAFLGFKDRALMELPQPSLKKPVHYIQVLLTYISILFHFPNEIYPFPPVHYSIVYDSREL